MPGRNLARKSFLSGFGDFARPLLLEKKKEQRAVAAKKQRTADIALHYGRVFDKELPLGEREKSFFELGALGVNVPRSAIEPKVDLSNYFDLSSTPQEIIDLYDVGAINVRDAVSMGSKAGAKPKVTPEYFQSIIDTGILEGTDQAGKTKEQLMATYNFTQALGKGALGGGEAGKPTAFAEKAAFIKDITHDSEGNLLPFETVNNDPNVKLQLANAGISQEELFAAYGVNQGSITEATKIVTNRVFNELGIQGKVTFGADLELWKAGEKVSTPSVQKTLDKYYDKTTGKLKDERVLGEAERVMELALKSAGVSQEVAKEIPENIKPVVLDLLERKMTKSEARRLWTEARDAGQPLTITEAELEEILEYLDE